jgi:hypothetical protein
MLAEEIIKKSEDYPVKFVRKGKDVLEMECIIAQRKAFLSTQKLTYLSKMRIDDEKKVVFFFEMLLEKSAGLSSGTDSNVSSGFGFQSEKYSMGGKKRDSTIEQQSNLFGKKYNYEFEYGKIRKDVEALAKDSGYEMQIVLNQKSI